MNKPNIEITDNAAQQVAYLICLEEQTSSPLHLRISVSGG